MLEVVKNTGWGDMYLFNEGGKHLTISYIPDKWLRIYLFGKVFVWGRL